MKRVIFLSIFRLPFNPSNALLSMQRKKAVFNASNTFTVKLDAQPPKKLSYRSQDACTGLLHVYTDKKHSLLQIHPAIFIAFTFNRFFMELMLPLKLSLDVGKYLCFKCQASCWQTVYL
jgi:hypothetical protein